MLPMRQPQSLLDRLLESDASFDKLFTDTRNLAHAIGFRGSAVRDAAVDPDDVAQEALLLALTYRNQESVIDPQAFLARCIRNYLFDTMRRMATRHRIQPHLLEVRPLEADSTSLDDLIRSELVSHTLEALATLPETYRVVLAMQYFEGMGYAQIADALDISEDAARQRSSRGHAHLKKLLARYRAAM